LLDQIISIAQVPGDRRLRAQSSPPLDRLNAMKVRKTMLAFDVASSTLSNSGKSRSSLATTSLADVPAPPAINSVSCLKAVLVFSFVLLSQSSTKQIVHMNATARSLIRCQSS
jgi:hypothetical protein